MNLHQIWVGSEKIPEKYEENSVKMKILNRNLKYQFWDNERAILEFPEIKKYLDIDCPGVYISDFLRLKILNKYGGWYVDLGFESLKPLSEIIKEPDQYDIVLCSYDKIHDFYNTGLIYVKKSFMFDFDYIPDMPIFHPFNDFIGSNNFKVCKIPLSDVGPNGKILKQNSTLSARKHKYYNYFLDKDLNWVHYHNRK